MGKIDFRSGKRADKARLELARIFTERGERRDDPLDACRKAFDVLIGAARDADAARDEIEALRRENARLRQEAADLERELDGCDFRSDSEAMSAFLMGLFDELERGADREALIKWIRGPFSGAGRLPSELEDRIWLL